MTKAKRFSYAQSGVDYHAMDPVKISAQFAAAGTASNLTAFGAHEISASRGESAYVWEESDIYRAFVIEGLGTKNLIADAMRKITGKTYYGAIAQDTVAAIVNDLIVVGALPEVINAYFAIGDSSWMRDEERTRDLLTGWAAACQKIGATWGGGETPTLKEVVATGTIDLAGSAIGVIGPKSRLVLGGRLAAGDVIILIESSGIHTNGTTLIRKLAERDSQLYITKLSDGRLFGETLLTPTHLYVSLVRSLLEADVDIHYMVHITGHGWRKIMRATRDLTYVLDQIPEPQPEFRFIQQKAGADDREMYGNFNMGAGFALYVPPQAAQKVVTLAAANNLRATVAGSVESGPKRIIIRPIDVTYTSDMLKVR